MNVNPIIISALEPLGIPVDPYESTKNNAETYIVFNYADERPAVRADNVDIYDETTVHVHCFTKVNTQPLKKAIRRLLRQSGFTIISTSEYFENNTRYSHIVVEAWIEGTVQD